MPLGFGAIGQGSSEVIITDLAAHALARAYASASFARTSRLQAAALVHVSARASFSLDRRGVYVFEVPPERAAFDVPADAPTFTVAED